ncbi:MAG: hypothetical protein ACTSXO_11540 [Candidatus Heimdallarchaeota archaeon]|nr:MAG: hypothetical protein DRO91_08710 [Candidatus Heimdallarchaeota archaeon]RLI70516.1 MAG: hypothetical protein DRP02_07575 [Candidatus Gerdarchaeota archaeon]
MKRLKYQKKIQKGIKDFIVKANNFFVKDFFDSLKKLQQLAASIPQQEQEAYEKFFSRQMTHELNLLRIEYKKIEFRYKDVLYNTNKEILKFENLLADSSLSENMRRFYQHEYFKVLEPLFYLEQLKENFKNYLEVLRITLDEFSEWFFNGRIDFLKQLLAPYIITDEATNKQEAWIYKRYAKALQPERKARLFTKAGIELKGEANY